MELRELLNRIGTNYDRTLGQKGEAQELLRQAPAFLRPKVSASYITAASGGKGNGAIVPWIAVFDPDETTTAQRGMYVVYLFAADMSSVALSLNQGVTELTSEFGTPEGRKLLRQQASAIRQAFPEDLIDGLDAVIDLRSRTKLPLDYEAGNILATTYALDSLPGEEQLTADLDRFVRLYEHALSLRTTLRLSRIDAVHTTLAIPNVEIVAEFKPKSDADYVQVITGGVRRVSRKHERLVDQYGKFLLASGFEANTKVHPRDLTASRDGSHWLIEAKMVRAGNGVQATREAIGQLLMYRDTLYDTPRDVRMLALFSESVGSMCMDFLERYQIASVWSSKGGWVGSPSAAAGGLAAPL
ncbi:MrcB family domain-containing protein [Kibdelosporangium aridum]|uniref:Type IV methyl-directed restriction enzyme EcoKMcrB subunit DNA-binding domain-containing protein n=1 Tax=Kibdelosporangium aridum TaxID=2030 RepID=A0A1W2EC32_KIBAR|nr:DUF3578 domain-containing protein [Kibdelosporangium aridum]SMD07299.1 protein of unknown function [Kibdelosporangium aridum]